MALFNVQWEIFKKQVQQGTKPSC